MISVTAYQKDQPMSGSANARIAASPAVTGLLDWLSHRPRILVISILALASWLGVLLVFSGAAMAFTGLAAILT